MTQDEIIRMAMEAGAVERYFGNQLHGIAFHKKEWLERFATLVSAHEREKLAEQEPVKMMNSVGNTEAYMPDQQTAGFNIPLYAALREALDHIADSGKLIPQFIPVGIVNDHHSITWMEEIVEDQAPIGAILYALQDSVGRNVSFAKEQK